jgi:hypothetical protein
MYDTRKEIVKSIAFFISWFLIIIGIVFSFEYLSPNRAGMCLTFLLFVAYNLKDTLEWLSKTNIKLEEE